MVMIVMMVHVLLMVMVVVMMLVLLMVMIVVMVFVLIVVVIMVMAAAGAVRAVVMDILGGLLRSQAGQLFLQGVLVLHGLQDLLAVQFLPRSGDDGSVGVVFPQQLYRVHELFFAHAAGAAEDDGGCVLDLVVVELAKVLHINLALGGIGHGDESVELDVVVLHLLNRTDDVGQLAHAGGLNDDAVGLELEQDLLQGLAEVAYQAAADAAGVHLGDLYAGVLQKAAVDADLTELILNEDQFFAFICFLNELLDQGRLTGAQKAGKNINFCHVSSSCSIV